MAPTSFSPVLHGHLLQDGEHERSPELVRDVGQERAAGLGHQQATLAALVTDLEEIYHGWGYTRIHLTLKSDQKSTQTKMFARKRHKIH